MAMFSSMLKQAEYIKDILGKIGITLSNDELIELIEESNINVLPLPSLIANNVGIKEDELLISLAKIMNLNYQRLKELEVEPDILDIVPPKTIFQYTSCPYEKKKMH